MLEQELQIRCNGKEIAKRVFVPESIKEKAKGIYGMKKKHGVDLQDKGVAMLFMFEKEGMQSFDMMWINQRIGYIALDANKRIVDVGVMRPWFSFKFVKCMYWIEVAPQVIGGLKKGDVVLWGRSTKT